MAGTWVFTGKLQQRLLRGGAVLSIKPVYRWRAKCPCYRCADPFEAVAGMVLCPVCGNKRCPHATDHALTCTASNLPGQPGSRY